MQAALLVLWLGAATAADAPPAPDTAVVCPAEFRPALAPWVELRASEGHVIRIVSNDGTPQEIRARIRDAARGGKLRFVVLVGGADPRMAHDAGVRQRSIPAHLEPAKVNIRWGSEPQIASDAWYADLDDDGVPDLAIGRLTVESTAELTTVVKKIVNYEKQPDYRPWRSRINFVAGVGQFDPMIDGVLEASARRLIAGGVPQAYETTLTYANWHSAYCPDPRLFNATTVQRLNEGCLFWVYMGHAQPTGLDYLQLPIGRAPILDRDDVPRLHCAAGAPIALFLACYTGAFDCPQRCLADAMLQADGGPVAVVGGSRVTMPYGMTVLGAELMDACFTQHAKTLGEALLRAKRRSVGMEGSDWSSRRLVIDALAKALAPGGSDLAAERTEHLYLFNLIGDPLLRLHYPQEIGLTAAHSAAAGDRLAVRGQSPVNGACTIELLADRTGPLMEPPARREFNASPAALADYQRVYSEVNDRRVCSAETKTEEGRFTAWLEIPAGAVGHCHLRAYVAGETDCAVGCADLEVAAAPAAAESAALTPSRGR